jgi:hypothetical protein
MWDMYKSGNEKVKPDETSYAIVINAIAKSEKEGKAQRALRTLRRMEKLHQAGELSARPNRFVYTAVLQSCALRADLTDRDKRKALDTAIFTLEELMVSQYASPNHVTYGTFFKACASLLPEDDEVRRNIILPVFTQACNHGQVDRTVLKNLRIATSPALYEEILAGVVPKGSRIIEKDLPRSWRRNVQLSRQYSTRPRSMARRKAAHYHHQHQNQPPQGQGSQQLRP